MCLVTLLRWQSKHSLLHCSTSRLMCGHTNQDVMSRRVAFMPGCDNECKVSNTRRRMQAGTMGLYAPVETSHKRVVPEEFNETFSSLRLVRSGC